MTPLSSALFILLSACALARSIAAAAPMRGQGDARMQQQRQPQYDVGPGLSTLLASHPEAAPNSVLGQYRAHGWSGRPLAVARRVSGESAASFHGGRLIESWHEQPLDHFQFAETRTFDQRYFFCDRYFESGGPIFFYAGNEADVMMYVNATGLIWENAERFRALVVFAEHRYYGETQPFGPDSWKVDPSFLSTEQAIADYARLVYLLKTQLIEGAENSPVIAFGGSYGGMLAAWLRMKHPYLIAGAIAASAPIGAFPGSAAFRPGKFWEVVTWDASTEAGAAPGCVESAREGFRAVLDLGYGSDEDRADLKRFLRLCAPIKSSDEAVAAAYWLQGAFDAYAMGNYPYESSYISGDPSHPLPPWPMRAACDKITSTSASPLSSASYGGSGGDNNDDNRHLGRLQALVEGLREAAAVLYNVSGDLECYELATTGPAAGNVGPWDWQFCTELDGQEEPYYPTNGRTDMFWDQGRFDLAEINRHCQEAWGVTPRVHHSFVQYGGIEAARTASNIVFSNGRMDPWSVLGVTSSQPRGLPPSVTIVDIPNGAHHVDLMFSHDDDTDDIKAARVAELAAIERWIGEHKRQATGEGGEQ